jgi:hypothetical protein
MNSRISELFSSRLARRDIIDYSGREVYLAFEKQESLSRFKKNVIGEAEWK